MPVDARTRKLAKLAINYCTQVKPGENVIISGGTEAIPFLTELYKEIILRGAHPITMVKLPNVSDFFYKHAKKHQIEKFPQYLMDAAKQSQAYIQVYTKLNTRELATSDPKKIVAREKVVHPIADYIVNNRDKIRRVTIAYPCQAMAQDAEMSLTEYENFVYGACLQDWRKLKKSADKITARFRENSEVHLIGENVDLRFKVHGEKAVHDLDAVENMPCGEVFMAPVRDSLNGWIRFEYPAIRAGKEVEGIFLRFEKGKVIEFDASKNRDFLEEMLNTDENASYVGEFGIGCNPKIKKFTKNLLFDEKIGGTIHLALGMAYKENGGGNDSAIHWDIVKDMSNAKIVLDGKIIQDKGKWKIRGINLSN